MCVCVCVCVCMCVCVCVCVSALHAIYVGVWNSQSSCGSIIGKLVSQAALSGIGWSAAFIIPGNDVTTHTHVHVQQLNVVMMMLHVGSICGVVGVLLLLTLVPHPHSILTDEEIQELNSSSGRTVEEDQPHDSYPTIPFLRALMVPGTPTC